MGLPVAGPPGLSVQTDLTNPSTRPGLRLPGRVTLTATLDPVRIDGVRLGLVGKVERDDGGQALVEFHRMPVAGPFLLAAGERRVVPFAAPMPWETPVSVVDDKAPLALRLGLRTEVSTGDGPGPDDMRPVFVHPLPVQAGVLGTLAELGFELRQAALRDGRLPNVDQVFGFHQVIGYWAAPLYAGPMSEVEVTFVTDDTGVDVILWLDRRLALAGGGHTSISRFRVNHSGADRADWPSVVDGWLRQAIDRHVAAHSPYPVHPHLTESPRVSRPPDRLEQGGDPGATAG
ncbi:sporulation protein [Plantactinospora sp. GCM10030261]|uniref:sporulation protein n=1 Tax=Plantactinospora sp. GCM10030261 TaxID=3273420 RepID=UPI003608D769